MASVGFPFQFDVPFLVRDNPEYNAEETGRQTN